MSAAWTPDKADDRVLKVVHRSDMRGRRYEKSSFAESYVLQLLVELQPCLCLLFVALYLNDEPST